MRTSWNNFRRTVLLAALLGSTGLVMNNWADEPVKAAKPVAAQPANNPAVATTPKIQIAVLLDTSSSMDGLINQARTQLWSMVNEFGKAKCRSQQPIIEVALFEYGNDRLPASEGYIRLVAPLTTDLDNLSKELFALTTNGGSEFCGQTIQQAAKTLAWSDQPGDLKCIFIAGNEPFNQGPVDYKLACKTAAERGITVSTIHCGDLNTGIRTHWADGAKLADGSYMSIDSNAQIAEVATPHDAKLVELSTQLNTTYIAYGSTKQQQEATANQTAQDANSSSISTANAAMRANVKASGAYQNAHWDLVDGLKQKTVKLEDLKEEQLPEELRKLKPADRAAYIEKKTQERAALQAEIAKVNKERETFIANARKEQANKPAENTLDTAIIKSARDQAAKKAFVFEEQK